MQFFYFLFNSKKYDIFFIWFADYHSFIPVFFSKMFKIYSAVNIGGYDADEILIGKPHSLKEKFRKFCVSYTVKNCSKLLPVSDVIKAYLKTAVDESKCSTVYCCVDTGSFSGDAGFDNKKNIVVTVGGGGEFIKEAKRKKLDYFIELGNEFNNRYPEYNAQFLAIGHNENTNTYNYLSSLIKSQNVKVLPLTKSIDELVELYKRASIYMQLSLYEAFGIAQIEAMLNGCIPVSNPGGAIPEIVGDAGFLIKEYDIEKYILIIKEILDKKHESLRLKNKQRVLNNFTLDVRRKKLLSILP